MSKINLRKEKIPFTQVANDPIYDANISLKAKGLYAYIQAKPGNWRFSSHRIATQCSDGIKSIRSGLRELEDAGYLTRCRSTTGEIYFQLNHKPQCQKGFVEKPQCRNATVPKRHSAETAPYNNKESFKNKDVLEKGCDGEIPQEESPSEGVNEPTPAASNYEDLFDFANMDFSDVDTSDIG